MLKASRVEGPVCLLTHWHLRAGVIGSGSGRAEWQQALRRERELATPQGAAIDMSLPIVLVTFRICIQHLSDLHPSWSSKLLDFPACSDGACFESIAHGQNASIRVIALDTLQRRSRGLVATVFDHIHRRKIGPCSTMLSCIRSVPDSSGAQVQWPTPHVWQFLLSSFCFQNDRQAAPRR